jgi:hypothetical protein
MISLAELAVPMDVSAALTIRSTDVSVCLPYDPGISILAILERFACLIEAAEGYWQSKRSMDLVKIQAMCSNSGKVMVNNRLISFLIEVI